MQFIKEQNTFVLFYMELNKLYMYEHVHTCAQYPSPEDGINCPVDTLLQVLIAVEGAFPL